MAPTDQHPGGREPTGSAVEILFVLGSLGAGGQERQLYYLCRELDARGIRPAVAVWNLREDEVYVGRLRALGIEVLGVGTGGPLRKLGALRNLVRGLRPGVLHSHAFYCNIFAALGTLGTGTAAVGVIRGHFPRVKAVSGPVFGRLCARWPRVQICNSQLTATLARGGGFWSPRDVHAVENGIDFDAFPAAGPPEAEPPLLIGVGSLLPVKRWDVLIDAAERLRESGRDFRLIIAGEGAERRDIERRIATAGLSDIVSLPGFTENVGALVASASVLALTSDHEGLPNVVVEAMAVGRPVVATRAGDTPRLVRDGETGLLADCGDAETVFRHLAALLDDPDLRERMGRAAREEAQRRFSLERLVEETLATYRSMGVRLTAHDGAPA